MDQPEISVIIPFLNEEENLPDLIAELEAFAPTMPVRMEVVFVDDGSTDGSLDLLRKAHFRNFSAKIVKLSRNFGSHPAVRAGFLNAGGAGWPEDRRLRAIARSITGIKPVR